jgi:hypothetical protein
VQRRFDLQAHDRTRTYLGVMDVEASSLGLTLAQLGRLMGTPLAPGVGKATPVTVQVRPGRGGALIWDRIYTFPGRAPVLVTSRKLMDRSTGLIEAVRCGVGMVLSLSVEDGALHFRSRRYFLQALAMRLPLPLPLTPGEAHVIHADLGQGRFRFTMSFTHPWFGRLFFQTGVFRDPSSEEACP